MAATTNPTTNQEAWKNVLAGPISVAKLDARGELTRKEVVNGGRTLLITPEERRLNSQDVPVKEQDVFHNGAMVPIRLLDSGSEDVRELASNPNLISETDMESMLSAQWKTFDKQLAEIDNPITIRRLYHLASAHPDCSHRKVQMIAAKMEELDPRTYAEVTAPSTGPGGAAPQIRAVTPK